MKMRLLEGMMTALFVLIFFGFANATIVAHYGFNEGAGSTLHDSSGCGNNGSISGATWTAGLGGGTALRFDGVDDYVEVPFSSSLAINSYGFTIEAWINPQSPLGNMSNYSTIVSAYYGNSYYLRLRGDGVDFHGVGTIESNQDVISPYAWSHIVGTYDGPYSSIYINGQLMSYGQTVSRALPVSTGHPLRIGAWPYDYGLPFNGLIDEITIYSNSLSAQEVQQRYLQHTSVPEPATMLLLGSGLLGVLAGRRLFRKQ